MNKSKSIFILMLTVCMLLGSIIPLMHPFESEAFDCPPKDYQKSQTSENPPFELPATNATTIDNGSLWVNGQEIFWRYFFPNTSMIQPKNFRFSFEIWWKTPDPGIVIIVDLSENEGESNSTHNYGTLGAYEEILETPEEVFIQYSIWMNTTYFFANETWASFGNEFIDEESLNLTVGIQHDTYFPIFEYTILRDTNGPSIQIIHPNYDESENKLVLDWSNTSFEIIITSMSYIKSVTFVVTFLNQTTFEPQDMIIWNTEINQDGGEGKQYVPSLITEKIYPDGGGLMDIDTDNPIPASLVVVDGYGYVTNKSLSIFLEIPDPTTTPTTPSSTFDWETMIPIVGSVSIAGIVGILLVRKRMRK